MIVIDTNALILLIVGLINQKKIPEHKCLSIYSHNFKPTHVMPGTIRIAGAGKR